MHSQDARVINEKDRRSLRHEIKIWFVFESKIQLHITLWLTVSLRATLHHENILPLYGACPDADVVRRTRLNISVLYS